MSSKSNRYIKSAHRVLEVLEQFDRNRHFLTVMELVRIKSYPQSTASELLKCMAHLGYLQYSRAKRTYSPTVRAAALGARIDPGWVCRGSAFEIVDTLAAEVGETAVLSTNRNYRVHHLYVARGCNENSIVKPFGDNQSVLSTALGRLLLSSYKDNHIQLAVHRMFAEDPTLGCDRKRSDIVEELIALREVGWLMERGRHQSCVAALVLPQPNADRLIVSVFASPTVIEQRGTAILNSLFCHRDNLGALR